MRRMGRIIIGLILIILGIGLFIYPRITDRIYKNKVDKLLVEYKELVDVKANEDTKLVELYNLLKDENEKIYNSKQREFLSGEGHDATLIDVSTYGLDNGIFGFVEIPSANILLPIYFGSSTVNMNKGATLITGTSYPIGGVNTNSVLATHRGYYKTKMFRNIDSIKLGDKLYIKNFDGILTYKAVDITIIKPDELDKLLINEGKDMVTIISCHPYPQNKERYVVYFERI